MARLSPAPNEPSAVAGALGDTGWSQLTVLALGVSVDLAVRGGGPGLLIDARGLLDDLDRKWNPSRPESLVAQLEAAGGEPVPVDDETFALIEASVAAAKATGGAVGSEGLALNPMLTRVAVPDGAVLDVDDLARAVTADQVAAGLVEAGADGAVVDAAGVLRLAGSAGEGRAWVVEVWDPDGDSVLARLGLAEGACATVERPTRDVLSLTVLAPEAASAIVLAAAGDVDLAAASGHAALVIGTDGEVRFLNGVEAFLRGDE